MARAQAGAQAHNTSHHHDIVDPQSGQVLSKATRPPGQGWRCCRCNAPLPKRGQVWRLRYRKWQQWCKTSSGYYCDYCADARESGHDY